MSDLLTYRAAKAAATRKNAGVIFRADAGQGWTSEVYWCPRRKRQIWTSIGPAGQRIV